MISARLFEGKKGVQIVLQKSFPRKIAHCIEIYLKNCKSKPYKPSELSHSNHSVMLSLPSNIIADVLYQNEGTGQFNNLDRIAHLKSISMNNLITVLGNN